MCPLKGQFLPTHDFLLQPNSFSLRKTWFLYETRYDMKMLIRCESRVRKASRL